MPLDRERRGRRLDAIRRILRSGQVESQDVLLERLRDAGHSVTQSSISRDLRELGVRKDGGTYRLGPTRSGAKRRAPTGIALVRPLVTRVTPAGPHLLVVHTVVGAASRVGLGIDEAQWPEVVGTVAGDDTLFIACPGLTARRRVERRLVRSQGEPRGDGSE